MGNTTLANEQGIYIYSSRYINLTNNTGVSNKGVGIYLFLSNYSYLTNNIIKSQEV